MVVVSGEDYHAINDATDISHHILRAVILVELQRDVGIDLSYSLGNEGVNHFDENGIGLLGTCNGLIGIQLRNTNDPCAILELLGPLGLIQFVGTGQLRGRKDAELRVGFKLYAVDGE